MGEHRTADKLRRIREAYRKLPARPQVQPDVAAADMAETLVRLDRKWIGDTS